MSDETLPPYRAADFFFLRAPLLPVAAFTGWPIKGSDTTRAELRARLRAAVASATVREALFIASPSLSTRMTRTFGGGESARSESDEAKLDASLTRYFA